MGETSQASWFLNSREEERSQTLSANPGTSKSEGPSLLQLKADTTSFLHQQPAFQILHLETKASWMSETRQCGHASLLGSAVELRAWKVTLDPPSVGSSDPFVLSPHQHWLICPLPAGGSGRSLSRPVTPSLDKPHHRPPPLPGGAFLYSIVSSYTQCSSELPFPHGLHCLQCRHPALTVPFLRVSWLWLQS